MEAAPPRQAKSLRGAHIRMRFIPHTEADTAAMLETLGVSSSDDLVAHVPSSLRARASINLPQGMGEMEVAAALSALAGRNRGADQFVSFLGGGYYRHYVPAVVRAITPAPNLPPPIRLISLRRARALPRQFLNSRR